ncbi:hypothetical protein DS742_07475 [Lacrimispora amygdalina]|uniref:Competence protein ComFB n=1 Tax=Lacrimispora amygdalina TaxID=253257 RepID=A0A3E2NF31_9FIRM|nr:late competence development ComFB family protein [Clostridium indicum]RFZ79606.1 hypothetical protein DS742_07475 [Clostridium indicum]
MYQVYNNSPFVPRNVMNELVEEKLDHLMHLVDMCCCSECRALVKELAMKELPSMHVTCMSEDVHARFAGMAAQTQANIVTAILHSAETVQKHSQHCPVQK